MELDEIKYLYLLFILPLVVCFFFNLKESSEFGDLELIKTKSLTLFFKPILNW
jgi:Ca-activated chloride channel family protein